MEAPPGFCREMLPLHSAEYAKGTSFVISCILCGMGQGNPNGFAYNIFETVKGWSACFSYTGQQIISWY